MVKVIDELDKRGSAVYLWLVILSTLNILPSTNTPVSVLGRTGRNRHGSKTSSSAPKLSQSVTFFIPDNVTTVKMYL